MILSKAGVCIMLDDLSLETADLVIAAQQIIDAENEKQIKKASRR